MHSQLRKMPHESLKTQTIVFIYEELFLGQRMGLPKGTWQKDENVIILLRYVLEIRLDLKGHEIPKITRSHIKEQKLWGALNRFKSVKKLVNFVYPNEYDIFDYHRVPANYWASNKNVKKSLEWHLRKNNISFDRIPEHVTYNKLIEWGFSNALKRDNDSPFRLINRLYPNRFSPFQFRKLPQGYAKDINIIKDYFFHALDQEQITRKDIPSIVNQTWLNHHGFSGALDHFDNSPSRLIMALMPSVFTIDDFTKPQGYWKDIETVKQAIENVIKQEEIPFDEIPKYLTKTILQSYGLGGLLHQYNGSPIEIINACFPDRFKMVEFPRLPNRYWLEKENRIEILRSYCLNNQISPDSLPTLGRAYFQQHFPKFVSVMDRYYESKWHLWVMEAYPEMDFTAESFDLFVGDDGQLCDSKEERLVHNTLLKHLEKATIKREPARFLNKSAEEIYIPDWIVTINKTTWILEYFGLYESDWFLGYTERADRKMAFYQTLPNYRFMAIMPNDIRKKHGLYSKITDLKNGHLSYS